MLKGILLIVFFQLASVGQCFAQSNASSQEEAVYNPYIADMERRITRAWFPPKVTENKRVMVVFKVHRNGIMSNLLLARSSGLAIADEAALKAIRNAAPFRPTPTGSLPDIDFAATFRFGVVSKFCSVSHEGFRTDKNSKNVVVKDWGTKELGGADTGVFVKLSTKYTSPGNLVYSQNLKYKVILKPKSPPPSYGGYFVEIQMVDSDGFPVDKFTISNFSPIPNSELWQSLGSIQCRDKEYSQFHDFIPTGSRKVGVPGMFRRF